MFQKGLKITVSYLCPFMTLVDKVFLTKCVKDKIRNTEC